MWENKIKILAVDDNLINLELLKDILNMAGYKCFCTTKGESAVEIATKERPNLILLDIQMPGMDGLTVKKILKSTVETKHIKIIAITAHAMKGDGERFLKEGFDGYIPKPFKINGLLETVRGYTHHAK